jgi:hypothetical protein
VIYTGMILENAIRKGRPTTPEGLDAPAASGEKKRSAV